MKNELIVNEENDIKDMIYEIRGKQVILDSDLANLFEYETKQLNRQVMRNIKRFPENYCFQLTKEEYKNLRCQNGTSNNHGGRRTLPYVFTEYGITMLAGILKSDVAISASLKIVNTFIMMRKFISSNLIEQKYINEIVLKDSKRIDIIEESLSKFKATNNHIFFEGQIYDAYSKIIDILSVATKELIIIDNYADKTLLDIISKINKKTLLITSKDSYIEEIDINKYQEQYSNLQVITNNTFHDRYFIIDKNIVYHCGSSINKAGTKTFSINKIEDGIVKKLLLDKIKDIKKLEIKNNDK